MTATERALEMTRVAALAADDKLGQDIVALDVSDLLAITDVFVIASANSDRQVGAIVDAVEEALREQCDAKPARREGDRENRWVLLDYLDIVLHIQHVEERRTYALERLWGDCPRIPLDLPHADDDADAGADSDPVTGTP